jgi:hypothetical protein
MLVTVNLSCSVLNMVNVIKVFSVPYGHSEVCSAAYDHCHSAMFTVLYDHCHSSLPPLCSGNERFCSQYSLTSKRYSSQSPLPLTTQFCTHDPTVSVNFH